VFYSRMISKYGLDTRAAQQGQLNFCNRSSVPNHLNCSSKADGFEK
jgi:hypothetical protein